VFVGALRLVPASQEYAQAAPNLDVCEGQITDAYRQIDSKHPQALATIAALEDIHCKGSPEACSLGANDRRNKSRRLYLRWLSAARPPLTSHGDVQPAIGFHPGVGRMGRSSGCRQYRLIDLDGVGVSFASVSGELGGCLTLPCVGCICRFDRRHASRTSAVMLPEVGMM
jgi:hypothetical protein